MLPPSCRSRRTLKRAERGVWACAKSPWSSSYLLSKSSSYVLYWDRGEVGMRSITTKRILTQIKKWNVTVLMYSSAPPFPKYSDVGLGGGLNQDLQNYKWNPLWLYMRLWDVKRFFEIFSVLTLHRPPQISEKWGKMAHFGRFSTFSYWLVWSLNY